MNLSFVVLALGGYLLGSIPFGLLVSRLLRGVDVREYGSGKIGTTNILRTLGPGPALAVLTLDILKGVIPVLVARMVSDDARLQVVAALAAIAGHDWPVYAGFRGGRGVATTFGATVAMMPPLGLILPLIAAGILYPFRIVSLMSIMAAVIGAGIVIVLAVVNRVPDSYAVFAVIVALLIAALHRDNIARLVARTEPRLGQGGQRRAPPRPVGSRRSS